MVTHENNFSLVVGAGAYIFALGHDAWVTGDEEFVVFEFYSSTTSTYAKD